MLKKLSLKKKYFQWQGDFNTLNHSSDKKTYLIEIL